MRKLLLIAASLSLASCANFPTAVPAAPSAIANKTILDEQIAITAELEYKAFRTAVEVAVNSGILKPGSPNAHKIAKLDNEIYALLQVERQAYNTANANDYYTALNHAANLMAQGYTILKGN